MNSAYSRNKVQRRLAQSGHRPRLRNLDRKAKSRITANFPVGKKAARAAVKAQQARVVDLIEMEAAIQEAQERCRARLQQITDSYAEQPHRVKVFVVGFTEDRTCVGEVNYVASAGSDLYIDVTATGSTVVSL